jgi:hypothetical protein
MRLFSRAIGGFVLSASVVGCTTVSRIDSPDPAAIPSGDPVAHGGGAIGPVTVLTSDRVAGIGWRLLIYESADGECLQFETTDLTESGCGDLLPTGDATFGGVSAGAPDVAFRPIYGIVRAEVATVFLIDSETQERVPAMLVPLDEAGLEGQAFIGFQPEGWTITDLQALERSGEIVETYELP